jgi:precorrin-2 dehydrogenase/sirohydrochlorin ferrochelatase
MVFPLALTLDGREALLVGAEADAPLVVERLRAAGARLTVVARSDFQPRDLDGKVIVFLTPGDDALARRVHERLAPAGRLVCALDRPELSTFVNMAIVSVSGLTIALGSDGASPGTLRRIREDLAALFSDPRFARYMEALRGLRDGLPRGPARVARMREAVKGFAIEARLRFPGWLERGSV